MTDAKQEAPTLVGWRDKKEKGMPTTGIVLLVGLPKSGKTTLGMDFPKSYGAELDRGDADHVAGRIQDVDDVVDEAGAVVKTKLNVFREILKTAATDPSVKTIVIDTIDTLSSWFIQEIKGDSDAMRLQDWGDLKERFENLIKFLQGCGKLVVFCSHFKPAEKDVDGVVIAPAKLAVSGSSAEYIAGRAKLIGYCYKKEIGTEQGYYVTFRGGPFAIWGSRVAELNDKTLKLPAENPFSAIEDVFKAKPEARASLKEAAAEELEAKAPAGEMGAKPPKPKARKETAGVR
jgi:hypothetical protein